MSEKLCSSRARVLADQGDVAATGDRPPDLERAIFGMRVAPGLTPDGRNDRARSGDLAEPAGLHVVDEAPHLILLGDEGAFLDALDGVADVTF
jgi:hypothetical protein